MSTMASQITGVSIVYSTGCSVADQRKHHSSASLAFVREIHQWIPRTKAGNAENVSIWWLHHALRFAIITFTKRPPVLSKKNAPHYDDVIMTTIASQITSLTIVYSTVYSDADQSKHQSSASLAFVWGIHRDRWIPRTKGQLRGKCFHLMTSSWKHFMMVLHPYQQFITICPYLLCQSLLCVSCMLGKCIWIWIHNTYIAIWSVLYKQTTTLLTITLPCLCIIVCIIRLVAFQALES